MLDFILPAINATVFSNYLKDLTFADSDMYLNELRRLRASHNQNVMYVILTDDYKLNIQNEGKKSNAYQIMVIFGLTDFLDPNFFEIVLLCN